MINKTSKAPFKIKLLHCRLLQSAGMISQLLRVFTGTHLLNI
jgi:hypothetical protein